jgi:RNA polymerase sigma-70 factor (ECF subfamily)
MSAQLNPSNALTPTDKALELSELTESQVIARAKLGDADAISALYERYEPKIRRYVLGRLGDPNLAEDICSDVFVKVLESLDRYEDRGWPFSAWLYRIAYARTIDVMRQTNRRTSVPLDEAQLGTLDPPDEAVMARMAYNEIKTTMSALTNEQQLVLRLRFGEDRSLADIAKSLGRSIGSVKALQHRGLNRLAQALNNQPNSNVLTI